MICVVRNTISHARKETHITPVWLVYRKRNFFHIYLLAYLFTSKISKILSNISEYRWQKKSPCSCSSIYIHARAHSTRGTTNADSDSVVFVRRNGGDGSAGGEGEAGVTCSPGGGAGREGMPSLPSDDTCGSTPTISPSATVRASLYCVVFTRPRLRAQTPTHTCDAVGFARTFAGACAYTRTDCTS